MSHGLPDILRYFLLALLWLFFLYAARMVLLDVRRSRRADLAQNSDSASEPGRRVPLRLRILEPRTRRGQMIDLNTELTLGRSTACAIALDDDDFASSVHARVFLREGSPWVEDLGSTNGTFVNEERIDRATPLERGDLLRVGGTVLEVRR